MHSCTSCSVRKNFTLTLISIDTLIFLSRSQRSNFFTYFLDSKKFVSPLCRRLLRSFHLFHVSFSFEVNHYVTIALLRITFKNHYIDIAMGILCDIIDFLIRFVRFHGAIVFTMIVWEWSITYVEGSFHCCRFIVLNAIDVILLTGPPNDLYRYS